MLSRTTILIFLAVLSFSNAHHMITNIHINGVDQGDGICVRVAQNTSPVTDIRSNAMACNVGGEKTLDKFCAVDAGQSVKFEWRTWPDGSVKTPIDVSHQGPCSVYMKKVNAFSDGAAGDGWFKIWNYGYENGRFCTDFLRENGGMMSVKIPQDLDGGRYLIRGEHLALHLAQVEGGAQWYIGCAQIVVYSTGGSARPSGVSIPGYVKSTDPGVLYDYWNNMHPESYTIPGPAPYAVTNTGGGNRNLVNYPVKYPVCLVANADWCAVPLPRFNGGPSCWASVVQGRKQLATCYGTAPETGHTGCTIYEAIHRIHQDLCQTCDSNPNCAGYFPDQPPIRRRHARAAHRYPLLPPLDKRAAVETTTIVASGDEDKLAEARKLCEQIAAKCKEDGIGGLCGVFSAACRGAVQPGIIGQFLGKSGRKWQALWLYQVACENENFEKNECKEKFSKAIWGSE